MSAGIPVARVHVFNRMNRPRLVFAEPWGEDFTLLPGESLEIAIYGAKEPNPPYFAMIEYADSTAVYLERDFDDYAVLQDGIRLPCGHQRQAALDAGLKF